MLGVSREILVKHSLVADRCQILRFFQVHKGISTSNITSYRASVVEFLSRFYGYFSLIVYGQLGSGVDKRIVGELDFDTIGNSCVADEA